MNGRPRKLTLQDRINRRVQRRLSIIEPIDTDAVLSRNYRLFSGEQDGYVPVAYIRKIYLELDKNGSNFPALELYVAQVERIFSWVNENPQFQHFLEEFAACFLYSPKDTTYNHKFVKHIDSMMKNPNITGFVGTNQILSRWDDPKVRYVDRLFQPQLAIGWFVDAFPNHKSYLQNASSKGDSMEARVAASFWIVYSALFLQPIIGSEFIVEGEILSLKKQDYFKAMHPWKRLQKQLKKSGAPLE